MIIYVDIDGVLCTQDKEHPSWYEKAEPIRKNIIEVNRRYEKGDTIVLWTARGCISTIDWRRFTENQLEKWGVKYHKLRLDKPFYDLFIDDRTQTQP